MHIQISFFVFAIVLCMSGSAAAADVIVQPASGSGFVIKDAGGTNERLCVNENGLVSLPGVAGASVQTQALCIGAAGLLGPCSGGGYAAGAGLALTAMAQDKDAQIAALREELAAQKTRVAALESLASDLAQMKSQLATLRLQPASATVAAVVQP